MNNTVSGFEPPFEIFGVDSTQDVIAEHGTPVSWAKTYFQVLYTYITHI